MAFGLRTWTGENSEVHGHVFCSEERCFNGKLMYHIM